ncbi:MAG: SGNH/GDSL hydrolase family protein [Pseudomonadota bacterium]
MSDQARQIIYFGDSLTDTGVIVGALTQALSAQIFAQLIAGVPNPTPEQIAALQAQALALGTQQALTEAQALGFGPEGAVTNEFTHAVYTGQVTGDTILNFANAGARAIGTQEPFGEGTGYDSNLGAQLARFSALPPEAIGPNAAAVLFIGANDFSDALGAAEGGSFFDLIGAATQTSAALLGALEAGARSLDAAGVETVFFGTIPVGSFFPGSDGLDALSSGLSDLAINIYNGLLAQTAASLRAEGLDVQVIDYAALAAAITEDPSAFGIIAARDEFLVDGAPFDSDQVGFWDPIHPAEAVQQAWGAYAAFVLEGGSTAALSDFGTISFQNSGNNAVFANGGNDIVFAFGGDDIVFGGTGDDRVLAGRGDDIAAGGAGADFLAGQSGSDILGGGGGNDTLAGGSGNDVLIDGLGDDLARGGSGDDVFIFTETALEGGSGASQDVFRGGSGSDTLYLVLGGAHYADFEANGAGAVLSALGITTRSIETVVAINGRGGVEDVLGGFDWFQAGDFWGLIAAPTEDSLLV